MAMKELVGTRLRENRLKAGVRQAELARRVGISPAYLNLIEHNRRRIAGKLLSDLARALDLDAAILEQGAEAALLEGVQAAAAAHSDVEVELREVDQLASRFPGWARLVVAQHQKQSGLERGIEELTDRMAHDPFLAENLHEILSVVTAIRSTSSILHQTPDIDPEWRARFHANLLEDSARLAATAQSLVTHFDELGDSGTGLSTPQEFVEGVFAAQGFQLARLERDADAVEDEVEACEAPDRASRAAARAVFSRYAQDARALPLGSLHALLGEHGFDPVAILSQTGLDPALVLRRLAVLGADDGAPSTGLVICDAAGALTFRKPLAGFAAPRYGAACALWPLYQSLHRLSEPMLRTLEMPDTHRYTTFAVCQPRVLGYGVPPVLESVMLVVSEADVARRVEDGVALEVGVSCRICPRADCAARREASVLSERV
ncbi:MAG: short-chain fatty acyl-CoA regulator family protein [Brevirhabdus sp.]